MGWGTLVSDEDAARLGAALQAGLVDLSPDDPVLDPSFPGTTYGMRTGGSYPPNPYTGRLGGQRTTTDWLNENSTNILIGASAFLLVMLFWRAGR